MRDKKLKISYFPNDSKPLKLSNNPDSYKDQNVSWQFSLMDFDFTYGWGNVINRIEFTHLTKDKLIEELMTIDCSDQIYNVIDELSATDFTDMHSFFNKLKSVTHLTSNEILCILNALKKNFFWDTLYPKLKDIESKKWKELELEQFGKKGKSKNHWVEVKDIIKPAKKRLTELNLDDINELYSIRLTGTQRIWGIRVQNYFRLLWFDFEHEICPSNKN